MGRLSDRPPAMVPPCAAVPERFVKSEKKEFPSQTLNELLWHVQLAVIVSVKRQSSVRYVSSKNIIIILG